MNTYSLSHPDQIYIYKTSNESINYGSHIFIFQYLDFTSYNQTRKEKNCVLFKTLTRKHLLQITRTNWDKTRTEAHLYVYTSLDQKLKKDKEKLLFFNYRIMWTWPTTCQEDSLASWVLFHLSHSVSHYELLLQLSNRCFIEPQEVDEIIQLCTYANLAGNNRSQWNLSRETLSSVYIKVMQCTTHLMVIQR